MFGEAVPIANVEAEQALLGAVLTNNRAYEQIAELVKPEHFFDLTHGRIYAVAGQMIDQGQQANAVTLKSYFENAKDLVDVGGAQYLAELQANFISVANIKDYGRVVVDLALWRDLGAIGQEWSLRVSKDRETPASSHLEELEAAVLSLAETGDGDTGLAPLSDTIPRTMDRLRSAWAAGGALVGLSTGFGALDALTGGLEGPDIVMLAARPGMGKTALALSISDRMAAAGRSVGFFSHEMGEAQLVTRLVAARSGVPFKRLQSGRCGLDERLRAEEQAAALKGLPLYIDGAANLTVHQIHARARRLKRKKGLDLVILDHLGYIKPPDPRASEVKQPGDKLKAIKAMLKSLGVPGLVLQQLSRANLQRDDKRPTLGDLRGSGMIEEDADAVWFIHRDAYYVEREEPKRRTAESDEKFLERHRTWQMELADCLNEAEILVAKQRNGAIDNVMLRFEGRTMSFDDQRKAEPAPGMQL